MRLEEELAELLAGLNVVLEDTPASERGRAPEGEPFETSDDMHLEDGESEEQDQSELCLFQTSREHYGVFYRLDLVNGTPQLRIFAPDEVGPMKMRCFLVRAAAGSPLRDWFVATREHAGSDAFDDALDTAQQHLLFAAGELMKRLFWSGDPETLCFPSEIAVRRLA